MAESWGKILGKNREKNYRARSEFGETNAGMAFPEFFTNKLILDTPNIFVNRHFIEDQDKGHFKVGAKEYSYIDTTPLGIDGLGSERHAEFRVLCDHIEDFDDTEYLGSGSLYWNGTGSVRLKYENYIQSNSYSRRVEQTNFKNLKMDLDVDGNINILEPYMSCDNGSNWFYVGIEGDLIDVPVGSRGKDVIFKIYNTAINESSVFPLEFPIKFGGEYTTINMIRIYAEGENY